MIAIDPFDYSEKEREFTDKLRSNGTIQQDWRYAELNWLSENYFNKIFEIGGDGMRILVQRENNGKKCCSFVFGPEAIERLNNKVDELYSLLNCTHPSDVEELSSARQAA